MQAGQKIERRDSFFGRAYVEDGSLRTFIASWGGSPAGYFELASREGEVQLAYFGLLPAFVGRGLGAALLTRAIEGNRAR